MSTGRSDAVFVRPEERPTLKSLTNSDLRCRFLPSALCRRVSFEEAPESCPQSRRQLSQHNSTCPFVRANAKKQKNGEICLVAQRMLESLWHTRASMCRKHGGSSCIRLEILCLSYSNQYWIRPNRRMTVSKPSSDKNNNSIGTNKHVGSAPTISNLWSKSIRSIAFSKATVDKTSECQGVQSQENCKEVGPMCPDDGGSNKNVKVNR